MRKTGAIKFNIPQGNETETSSISSFKGLHISDNPLMTSQDSAADMKNVYLTLENTLSTRPRLDFKTEAFSDVKEIISYIPLDDSNILYHYIDTTNAIKLVLNDTVIIDGDDVGSNKIYAFKKDDKVYVLSDEGYFVIYNGTLHNVIDDNNTYIPTTSIMVDGVEQPLEENNLLSSKYKRKIIWDGISPLENYYENAELGENDYFKHIMKYQFSRSSIDLKSFSKNGDYIFLQKSYIDPSDMKYIYINRDSVIDLTDYNLIPSSTTNNEIFIDNYGKIIVYSTDFQSFKVLNLNTLETFTFTSTNTYAANSGEFRKILTSADGSLIWIYSVDNSLSTTFSKLELFCKSGNNYSSKGVKSFIGNYYDSLNFINLNNSLYYINCQNSLNSYLYRYEYDSVNDNIYEAQVNAIDFGYDSVNMIISEDVNNYMVLDTSEVKYYDITGTLLKTIKFDNPILGNITYSNMLNGNTYNILTATLINNEWIRKLYQVNLETGFYGEILNLKDNTYKGLSNNNFIEIYYSGNTGIPNEITLYYFETDLLPHITYIYTKETNSIISTLPVTYAKNFYNNYWLCYKNKLYNTKYNDPTYIPEGSESIIGDDGDITGLTLLTDSSMCVYKEHKQFVVYASTDSSGNIYYYHNEMKTDQGNLPKYQTLVTTVTEYPLQFNDNGIFVLKIPDNINTDTNTAISISEKMNPKFLREVNKENIITHNHLYWTYVILPQDNYSKMYVLDNRTNEWYYWEVPIKIVGCREVDNVYDILKDYDGETIGIFDTPEWSKTVVDLSTMISTTFTQDDTDYYDRRFYKETEFISDDGVVYTFTTVDFYDEETGLGTIYCDMLYDGSKEVFETIDWFWESEIMPLTVTKYYKAYPAVGYGKQLYQTGFLFVDNDKTEDYQLYYKFTVYRKHMADKNTKELPANTLNYIRSVVKRTRIPKFNFVKIKLSSPEDVAKNRFNLISLKFKYRLTQEVK